MFKFWEPYGIPGLGGKSMSYRHTASGQINYSPDLTDSKILKDMKAVGVTCSSKGLVGQGEVVIPVSSPYYISGGVLVLEATCGGEGDSVSVSIAAGKDKSKWEPAALIAKEAGTKQYKVRFDGSLADGIKHQYLVKIAIAGKAEVNNLYLRTGFIHNAMSAPHLMPGDNKVKFEVENAQSLKDAPVTLVYRYRDAPKWSEEKRMEKAITASPFTFDVKLPETGDKLPQMLDITLTCGKLAWIPKNSTVDKVVVDFSSADSVRGWTGNKEIPISHDGLGMLMDIGKGVKSAQVSAEVTEDWSNYKMIVVDFENMGSEDIKFYFRVRSDKENKQRTDVDMTAGKGKSSARIPVSALTKTKVNAINKIYFYFANAPESGAKLRVNKITLEADKEL
jgi:hypothetical protein